MWHKGWSQWPCNYKKFCCEEQIKLYFLSWNCFLRINSHTCDNTVTGSVLLSWWKYLALMELMSLHLWSKVKEWLRKNWQSHLPHDLPVKSDFPADRLAVQRETSHSERIEPSQHSFYCYICRDKKMSIWNSIILRHPANLCPCFDLVSLTPGTLLFLAGRLFHAAIHSPNSGTGDKCQFRIYLFK